MSVVAGTPQAQSIGSMPMLQTVNNQHVTEAGDSFQRLGSFGNALGRLESAAPGEGGAMNLFGIERLDSVAQNHPFARLSSDPQGFGRVPSTPFNANAPLDRLSSTFPNFPNMNVGFERTASTAAAQVDTSALNAAGFGRLSSLSAVQAPQTDLQNLIPQNQQQQDAKTGAQNQPQGQAGQPPPTPQNQQYAAQYQQQQQNAQQGAKPPGQQQQQQGFQPTGNQQNLQAHLAQGQAQQNAQQQLAQQRALQQFGWLPAQNNPYMQPGMQHNMANPGMAVNLGAMGISRVPSLDNSQAVSGGVWPGRTSSVVSEFGRTASDPAVAAYAAMRTASMAGGEGAQWQQAQQQQWEQHQQQQQVYYMQSMAQADPTAMPWINGIGFAPQPADPNLNAAAAGRGKPGAAPGGKAGKRGRGAAKEGGVKRQKKPQGEAAGGGEGDGEGGDGDGGVERHNQFLWAKRMGQDSEPRWGLFKKGGSAGPAFLSLLQKLEEDGVLERQFATHVPENLNGVSGWTVKDGKMEEWHERRKAWFMEGKEGKEYKPNSFYQILRRLGFFPTLRSSRAGHGYDFEASNTFQWDPERKYVQRRSKGKGQDANDAAM